MLRNKIKFSKSELAGELSVDKEPKGEVKEDPEMGEYARARIGLKEGLDFYKKNPNMPGAKKSLKTKMERYKKSLMKFNRGK